MTTNFMVKMGEIGQLTFIRRLGIPKRSRIWQFRSQKFICDDLGSVLSFLRRSLLSFVSVIR